MRLHAGGMTRTAGRFIGREAQLEELGELVERARGGESVTVFLVGDAGIGKSRLVREGITRFAEPNDVVAIGHGVELAGGELPYGMVADSLRSLVRDLGVQRVRAAAGEGETALAALCPALGVGAASVDRASLLPAYVTMVEALAADRLMWLVVEDLHWADVSSRDLLSYLIRVMGPGRLLTIVRVRPPDPDPAPDVLDLVANLTRWAGVHRRPLEPLANHDVADLVSDLTDGVAAPRLLDRVVDMSQGNPLLAEQLVAAGDFEAAGSVPETLLTPTVTRLRRLDPDTRRLLQLASLADGHLSHGLLRRAFAGTGAAEDGRFDAAIRAALDAQLLRFDPNIRGYTFPHALLRWAVETTVHPVDRLHGHRRWAELLAQGATTDPELLFAAAHHWAETDADPEAFEAALGAVDHAERLHAWGEMATLLSRALALWDRLPDPETRTGGRRDRLLSRFLIACALAGWWRRACEVLDAELHRPQSAGLPRLDLLALRFMRAKLGGYAGEPGNPATMEEALAHVEEFLASAEPAAYTIPLLWGTGWRLRYADPALSLRLHERALELAGKAGSPRHLVGSVGNLALSYAQRGLFEEGLALCRREAAATDDPEVVRAIDLQCEELLHHSGDFTSALAITERELAQMPSPHLDPTAWLYALYAQYRNLVALGRWSRAEEVYARACQFGVSDDNQTDLQLHALGALLACHQGNLETAAERAAHARSLLGAPPECADGDIVTLIVEGGDAYGTIAHIEAEVAAARGDLDAASNQLVPMLDPPSIETRGLLWPIALSAVRVAADRARRPSRLSADSDDETEAALRKIHSVVERLPRAGPLYSARHLQATADLARCRRRDDADAWRRAAEAWRSVGEPHQLGWANLHLAAALVVAGRRDQAHDPLAEAGDIAESLGAGPLRAGVVDLARRTRIATGLAAETGRRESSRLARLTARELEVLEQLARGKTNEEVAAALFISPKTASVHVSRILAKLGVSSRAKAAAIAYEEGLLAADGA